MCSRSVSRCGEEIFVEGEADEDRRHLGCLAGELADLAGGGEWIVGGLVVHAVRPLPGFAVAIDGVGEDDVVAVGGDGVDAQESEVVARVRGDERALPGDALLLGGLVERTTAHAGAVLGLAGEVHQQGQGLLARHVRAQPVVLRVGGFHRQGAHLLACRMATARVNRRALTSHLVLGGFRSMKRLKGSRACATSCSAAGET